MCSGEGILRLSGRAARTSPSKIAKSVMIPINLLTKALFIVTGVLMTCAAMAAQVQVAVAANFAAPMKLIAQAFERDTGHKAVLSFGATGQFYAQIKNAAPFEALLAADDRTPAQLESEGLTVPGSRFSYATGRLVLWSRRPDGVDPQGQVLKTGAFARLAIANPKLSPYGAAAAQTLSTLGLSDAWAGKIVEGANVAQTYQFVASGNAELGFVALSQVTQDGKLTQGSAWRVPTSMHQPLIQSAVLLKSSLGNPAATALWAYLKSEQARGIIRSFGYDL